MASDTGLVGQYAYIAFGGTVLDSNYRTLTGNSSIGLVDQSAGADTGVTRLTTLEDSNFSLTIKLEATSTGTANWAGLTPGASGTFEFGPDGTTSNYKRAYVTAILESIADSVTYNDIVTRTFTFQQNDNAGVTYTTYA